MSNQKGNIFHAVLIKQNGKLVHKNNLDKKAYKDLLDNMEEGQMIEIFMDACKDDGSLSQLARIHANIRELALQTGYSFEDMKDEVKRLSGLVKVKVLGGDKFIATKSFSICSKDELSLAIQAIIELGDFNSINFR